MSAPVNTFEGVCDGMRKKKREERGGREDRGGEERCVCVRKDESGG